MSMWTENKDMGRYHIETPSNLMHNKCQHHENGMTDIYKNMQFSLTENVWSVKNKIYLRK